MTQPPITSRSSGPRSAVAAHPVASAVIAVLIIASIFFSLYVCRRRQPGTSRGFTLAANRALLSPCHPRLTGW